MKSLTILDNEKFLRQKSKEVLLDDKALENDIKILEEYCLENDVLAMAAVQLGIPKRIIYLKNTNLDIVNRIQNKKTTIEDESYNEKKVLINPVVIKKEGLTEYWEACASCLNNMGLVERPYKIIVEYVDILGEKHKDTFIGFESTVLSHELDHLDGVLHIDIAKQILEMTKEERGKFRSEHDYKIISKEGDYDKLKELSS